MHILQAHENLGDVKKVSLSLRPQTKQLVRERRQLTARKMKDSSLVKKFIFINETICVVLKIQKWKFRIKKL